MFKNLNKNSYLFFILTLLYLEIAFKFLVFEQVFNIGFIYTILFTIPIGLFLAFLTKIFNSKINKILMICILIILTFYFIAQFIFIKLFSVPFSFATLNFAGQAFDFLDIVSKALLTYVIGILILLVPIVYYIIVHKKINLKSIKKKKIVLVLIIILLAQASTYLSLLPGKKKLYSSYQLYYNVDASNKIIDRFGLITGTRIDIKRLIFGFEQTLIIDDYPNNDKDSENINEINYNMVDIDFENLISETKDKSLKDMHSFFSNQEPTNKNEYTGLFKGKNLIFIVAEGFNEIAVQKDVTPTLYKLANEGFIFNNFYTPVMLSTIGGEFQALTGLIPTQETINTWTSKQPLISYALGNSFSAVGYNAAAYHNWTYTYYDRVKTRPTVGFSNYLGCRNGLEKLMNCNTWPTSDYDFIKVISPKIVGQEENHVTYILTVSGHANYNWSGNYIASKNRNLVENLPYSEEVKGYLATQMELDKALELLLSNLEAAGELEDTVIALVGDHYPYSFSLDQINELSDYKRDSTFEVNKSKFILWNPTLPKIEINKVSSQIDVLPTLLNLFGIEYDSRLIMGKDILSDNEGLAIFSNRSWISDKGRYNSMTQEFSSNSGNIDNSYIAKMNTIVANKFTMSGLIISKDYYRKILK